MKSKLIIKSVLAWLSLAILGIVSNALYFAGSQTVAFEKAFGYIQNPYTKLVLSTISLIIVFWIPILCWGIASRTQTGKNILYFISIVWTFCFTTTPMKNALLFFVTLPHTILPIFIVSTLFILYIGIIITTKKIFSEFFAIITFDNQ